MQTLNGIRKATGAALAASLYVLSTPTWPAGDGKAPADANADIFGRWKIAKVLDFADIAAMSESDAKKMVGKSVVVAKDKLVFNGEACAAPPYERTVEDTAKTLREKGHVSSANMGLPERMTAIDGGCTDLYLKGKDRIVIHWKGFYFDAVKQQR